jgi:hypothetical protein
MNAALRQVVGVTSNTRFLPYLWTDVGYALTTATGFAVGALIGGKPSVRPFEA